MQAAIDAFLQALTEHGIRPGKIEADGRTHRCGTEHKLNGTNGAYRLYLDGKVPAGWFQNHENGGGVIKWRAERATPMTEAERLVWRKERDRRAAEKAAEKAAGQAAAARKARRIWEAAEDASPHHPYLTRKNIRPHETRKCRDLLVVPLTDETGEIVNLQYIAPDGTKRFLKGARKQGCYHVIGEPDLDPDAFCIGEGFATMASVHEKSGYMSVVAFDCGNLQAVGEVWRKKLPDARMVICADDDAAGIDAAKKVAAAVSNTVWVLPPPAPGRLAAA